MVALPPHSRDDSDNVIQSRADERLAWAFSRFRSVTRDCAVSFVPSSPLPSEISRQPLYPFSVSISWQEIKGINRCVCFVQPLFHIIFMTAQSKSPILHIQPKSISRYQVFANRALEHIEHRSCCQRCGG